MVIGLAIEQKIIKMYKEELQQALDGICDRCGDSECNICELKKESERNLEQFKNLMKEL